MGLSERFELIHAEQHRRGGSTAVQSSRGAHGGKGKGGGKDKRTRKHTLFSAMAGGIGKESGRAQHHRPGGGAQGGVRKAQFQAELISRVAAASGPGGWEAAWSSAHAGAAQAHAGAGAQSWDQAGWQAPTARTLDLSTGKQVTLRGKGHGGGKGKGGGGGGKGKGKGRGKGKGGGRGQQGLAIKWRRPPTSEEQAVLRTLSLTLTLTLTLALTLTQP